MLLTQKTTLNFLKGEKKKHTTDAHIIKSTAIFEKIPKNFRFASKFHWFFCSILSRVSIALTRREKCLEMKIDESNGYL